MTSNIFHIIAFGVGFKCPRKIHLNTQWGGQVMPNTFITNAPPGFSDLPLVLYLDITKIIMPWMSSAIYPSIFGKVKRNQWSFMLITIIYTKYWIHRLKELGRQDDVLAGKLSFYQGCLPYEADQDGGMDGKCREIHFQNHGWQSLHIGWIQAREGQLPRKYLPYF